MDAHAGLAISPSLSAGTRNKFVATISVYVPTAALLVVQAIPGTQSHRIICRDSRFCVVRLCPAVKISSRGELHYMRRSCSITCAFRISSALPRFKRGGMLIRGTIPSAGRGYLSEPYVILLKLNQIVETTRYGLQYANFPASQN